MSPQPSGKVDFSLSHYIHFVPSSLSLVEQRGQHDMYFLSWIAEPGWAAIGWPWSCDLRANSHWKEADRLVFMPLRPPLKRPTWNPPPLAKTEKFFTRGRPLITFFLVNCHFLKNHRDKSRYEKYWWPPHEASLFYLTWLQHDSFSIFCSSSVLIYFFFKVSEIAILVFSLFGCQDLYLRILAFHSFLGWMRRQGRGSASENI